MSSKKKPRIGIQWKLFACFMGLTAFALVLLWLFQIVWLDDFYEMIKKSELRSSAKLIAANIENEEVQGLADKLASDTGMCILVYDGEGSRIASSDTVDDCLIHRATSESLGALYQNAKQKGGAAFLKLRRDAGEDYFYASPSEFEGDVPSGENELPETMVYTVIVPHEDGEAILFLNNTIRPVTSTTRTLMVQLSWISGLLVICSLVLAVIFSRVISRPIEKMNRSAAILARGHYDVTFDGGGYKEAEELSETLSYAASELSKLDAMQKELIANISHDLRTPLTMIAGYSEVMRDIPGENTPENMQVVIDETNRLSSLVSDMLDISRIQREQVELSPEALDLNELIRETLRRYTKLCERDGYRFMLDCEGEAVAVADRTRILQVLYNLMNNAVNYTGADKTVFVATRVYTDRVRVEIRDTGEGIPEEQLPVIWERYYRGERVHKRAVVGTGLGLSIVKNILLLHGARFGVSSELGQGSTFWFELRTAQEQA